MLLRGLPGPLGQAFATTVIAKPTSRVRSHLPAVDGVRGVAILLVMLTHTWQMPKVSWPDRCVSFLVSIGWSGVELFFVLSGFLITGILLDSKGGRHYFRNFYLRRILRIFPLYYAMLAVIFVAATVLPHSVAPSLGNANGQLLWYVFHLSNLSMAAHRSVAGPLLSVTWSLSVEEQFYVAWPFVVWVLPRPWLLRLCLALVVLSFACRLVLIATHVDALVVYLLTPSQLGGIAAGAAVAVLQRTSGGIQQLVSWARGTLVVAPALLVAIGLAARPAGFSLLPFSALMASVGMLLLQLLFAALLVAALARELLPRCVRLLETRVLRACGRWSFAMYLLHTPLILAMYVLTLRRGWPLFLGSALPVQLLFTAICVGVTVMLAALSWRFYEQPILRLKRLFPMEPQFTLATPGALNLTSAQRNDGSDLLGSPSAGMAGAEDGGHASVSTTRP